VELDGAELDELGAEGVLEAGAAAGVDADDSLVDEAAGLSEDLAESDFESDEESLVLESLELELLGA
jgi:hypothetical protein